MPGAHGKDRCLARRIYPKNKCEHFGIFILGRYKHKLKIYYLYILKLVLSLWIFFYSGMHVLLQYDIYDYTIFTQRPKFRYFIFFWWHTPVVFFLLNTLMVRCLNIWMTFFHPTFGQILKSRNLVRGFTKSINHMLSIVIQKVYSHLHYQKCPLVQFPRAFDNIKIYSLLIYSNVVRNCHSCLNTCFFIRWLVIYNSYCVN